MMKKNMMMMMMMMMMIMIVIVFVITIISIILPMTHCDETNHFGAWLGFDDDDDDDDPLIPNLHDRQDTPAASSRETWVRQFSSAKK